MKKTVLLLLALMLVSFAACGKKAETAQTTIVATESATEPVAVETPENTDQVFFNIDKALNSVTDYRPDRVSGFYTIRFLNNGQIVEYQTKKEAVPSQMNNLLAVVLTLDNAGLVKKVQSVQSALGGQFHDSLNVTGVNGQSYETAEMGVITAAADICVYDVSGRDAQYGEVGEIKTGDKIACYMDETGVVTKAYILERYVNHDVNHQCVHCGNAVEWTSWDGTAALTSGHYCLDGDVSLEAVQKINNADVVLCLNGHHIVSKHRVFEIGTGASLSVVDHAGAAGVYYGSVTGGGLDAKNADPKTLIGGSFFIADGGALKIYGGNFNTQFPLDKSSYINMGGVIYSEGVFELIDGVVTGADVGYSGGAAYIGQNGTFKMSGGVIRYGSAYKQKDSNKKDISGTGRGGTIVIAKNAKFAEMTGGKLIAGIVDGHGGGLYTEISMTISNTELCGDYVDGTQQAEYGGVMWVGGKETVVDLKEGTVFHSGNSIEGGNIAVRLHNTLNIHEGVVIRDGYGSRNGGNLAVFGTVNLKGGTIENGCSDGSGGNIFAYTNGATYVNISDGLVSGGVATRGGNVALSGSLTYEEGSVLTMTGGEVRDGIANKYDGGNIALRLHSVANITGGVITGGSALQYGGGVSTCFTDDSDTATTLYIGGSAVIFDNVDSDVYVVPGTVVTMQLDEPLTDDAKIGIMAVDIAVPIIEKAYEKCLTVFIWNDATGTLALDGTDIYVK